jgi:hypothetical protein
MGRKSLPAKLKRSERIQITLTATERVAVEKRAYSEGYQTVAEFIRAVLMAHMAKT